MSVYSKKKSYELHFTHDIYEWSVFRSYKDMRKVHKELLKMIKKGAKPQLKKLKLEA
jgi:hypothetical protein